MGQPELPRIDFERIGPRLGDRLDDIVLPNQHGDPVDLHARRGDRRAVLVVFRSARLVTVVPHAAGRAATPPRRVRGPGPRGCSR